MKNTKWSSNRLGNWVGSLLPMVVAFGLARAQEVTSRDFPGGPPLQTIPEYIRWEVVTSRVESPPSGSDNPAVVRKVVTLRTGRTAFETTDAAGVKTEKWQVGPVFYLKLPGQTYWGEYTAEYLRNATNDDPLFRPVPMMKFRGLDWVGVETFVAVLTDGGREFLVYLPEPFKTAKLDGPKALSAIPQYAKVDAKTRLPEVVRDGPLIHKFTFSEIPRTLLELPPDLVREIKEGQERRQSLFSAPGKEY